MELPSQLKKSNTCVIMSDSSGQINTMDTSGEKRLSANKTAEHVTAMLDLLMQEATPKLSDFDSINLKKLQTEIPKFDSQMLAQLCRRSEFCRNCESLLEEILDSDLIIEFGKKLSSSGRGKILENVMVERLTNMVSMVGTFLYFESVAFNEITFCKEIRVVSNITRSVLPAMLSENTKNCRLEVFNASFIGCLETIYAIIRTNSIPELISTQMIIGLLSVFSIEDSSTMMLLVVEIVVQLFVSGSLNSKEFLENSLGLIFSVMGELPQTNRAIKKARLCIEMDSYLHAYVYLLVRLVQSVCIPNGIVSNDNISSIKDSSVKSYGLARLICSQFATFFINSVISHKAKRKDSHTIAGSDIATVILTDLLKASFNPKYSICSTITHIIIVQLIKISNSSLMSESGPKSQSANIDFYSRELCVNLLGASLSVIYKSVNLKLTNINSPGKATKQENTSDANGPANNADADNQVVVDCICGGNSCPAATQKLLKCEGCNRNFHLECIRSGAYLEIYELWKCDSCILNLINGEIKANFGINGEQQQKEDWELRAILISVLDYLCRKTAMTVSQSSTESVASGTSRIVTDSGSSAVCSFILEMIAKLKLGNKEAVDEKEKIQTKDTKNSSKNTSKKGDIGQLHTLLLTEWTSPITKVHSPLVTHSSKLPKLLEANTIRFWNYVLARELRNIANIILHCLLSNIYNSTVISMRRVSLNSLGQIISLKPSILITNETVLNAIILSLKDKTPKVRERALAIIEKHFSDVSFFEESDYILDGEDIRDSFERVTKLLLEQIFRTAYDVSPLVRMASIKILRAIFHQDPSKFNIGTILLKRASAVEETQAIRKLVFDSFVSIWFHDSSRVNGQMAESLVRIINYSESDEFLRYINREQKELNCFMKGVMSILQENQSNRNMEALITRWSNILVDIFIQSDDNLSQTKLECVDSFENKTINDYKSNEDAVRSNLSRDFSEARLQILKAAEVIGKFYPKSITKMYPYIVIYLKDFRQFKSEVMIHICTVLSYILPHIGDLEAEGIELDLLKIVTSSKSPQLIRSSILCLCNLIMDNEIDLNENNALFPLILDNIRILWEYRQKASGAEANLDLKEVDQVRRSAWLLGCIFEYSSPKMVLALLDDKLERAKMIQTEFGISWTVESSSAEKVPKSEFGEGLELEYKVLESSSVVFDLLCDLYYILDWNLNKGVLFPTLIQFLTNQKQFVKTVKFNNLIKCTITGDMCFMGEENNPNNKCLQAMSSVKSGDKNSNLCIICLQGILSLLKSYEMQAFTEHKTSQEKDLDSSKRAATAGDTTSQFYDELNQSEDIFSGNSNAFSTPNTNKRTSMQSEKNELGSSVCSSSYSNMDNLSSVRTSVFGSVINKTTSASAAQPIASNLDLLLNLFQETTGFQEEGRFSNKQKQLASSLILCIIEQLNKQGLVNPTSIIPQVSGLLFSSNREVSYKSYQIISSLFERFPNLIINKYKEISVYGFLFCVSNFPGLLGAYHSKNDPENVSRSVISNDIAEEKIYSKSRFEVIETIFEFFTRIYSERCRNKKIFRESIIRGCCKQLEILMSSDETEVLLGKLRAHLNLENKVLLVLYMEFISYLFLAMPYLYESEILLVLFCLGEICVACSQNLSHDSEHPSQTDAEQHTFSCAILATVCTTIQQILKEEYTISENQISSFNPYNSINKEKPKYSHQDPELNSGVAEGSTNVVLLGRSTIYESLEDLRVKLREVWDISQGGSDSNRKLAKYANEIIYLYTQTTCEKASKPVKKKVPKKKPNKRSRYQDDFSDSSSSEDWSPSSRTSKGGR